MRKLSLRIAAATLGIPGLMAQSRSPLGSKQDLATIHIRLLNGRTGQPVVGKQIFFDRSGRLLSHQEDHDVVTGPDGIASAEVPESGYLVDPVVADLRLCTKAEHVAGKKDKAVQFSVAEVLRSGILAKNSCGTVKSNAMPGELVLWVRPMSALERLTD